jgi:hypothetical protein
LAKILQYKDLKKMGDQLVYHLGLPPFFEIKMKAGWPLDEVLESNLDKASTFVSREAYPKAVATKEEWLEATIQMRKEDIEKRKEIVELLESI